jgi:hypothetical protein
LGETSSSAAESGRAGVARFRVALGMRKFGDILLVRGRALSRRVIRPLFDFVKRVIGS